MRSTNLPNDIVLLDEARVVASPIAASPPGALVEELHTRLQCGLDLALVVVLNPGLPLVTDKPARHKIVVVSVEGVVLPPLVFEALQEIRALENFCPISTGPPRHTRRASVQVVSRRDFEVASLNVCCSKPIPACGCPVPTSVSSYTLTSANTSNLGILERSENPRHKCRRPGDIIICHDDDAGADMRQSFANLKTLVGNTAT